MEFYRCLPLQRRDCLVNGVDVASHDLSIDRTWTQTRTQGWEAGNKTFKVQGSRFIDVKATAHAQGYSFPNSSSV